MKTKEGLALFGLAALWGASFLFIKIASPVFGPLLTIQGRVTIAAIALYIILLITKTSARFKQRWKQYLILGAINAAIPFTFIALAALYLPASVSSILNSLVPLFTVLVVWGWMKEPPTLRKWFSIIVGMVGVTILVGWSTFSLTTETMMAVCFSILSTVLYGFGGVYSKKFFKGVSPLALATGQQVGASIVLLPFTIFHLPASTSQITGAAIFSVIGLALFCTAIAYLIYFYLIDSVGPTKTQSVTFLVPAFGIFWSILILQEKLTIGMVVGLLVILGSIFLLSDTQIKLPFKKKHEVASQNEAL